MCWLILVLFPLFLNASDNKPVIGWIVKCKGTWQDSTDASRPVNIDCRIPEPKLWYPVTIDVKLERRQKKLGEFVVFRDGATGQRHVLSCDEPKNCAPFPPIRLYIPRLPAQGFWSSFFANVDDSYTQIRLMQSRSSGSETDAVIADHVVAEEGSIFIRELLRPAAPAGDYLVEACLFNAEKGCPEELNVRKIHWEPTGFDSKWPDSIPSGLYEIVRVNETDGIAIRTKDRGLLLVAPKSNGGEYCREIRSEVTAAEATFFRDWQDKNEGQQMFKAFLLYLSQRMQK